MGNYRKEKGKTKTGKCKKGTARKCGKSCMEKLPCKKKNSTHGKKTSKKRKEKPYQLRSVDFYK